MKKNRLGRLVTSLMAGALIISIPLATVQATVSQNVNFTFSYNVVSGAKNNKYHKLSKGYVNLKLAVSGQGKSTEKIDVSLFKERWGPDDYYGVRPCIQGKGGASVTTTHEYYVGSASSDFYIKAEKVSNNYTTKGVGTIKNK
ncbi:hypothetical protein BMT55_16395 [Listeria newyorkensis]|uniref:Uncharacterized protein n=1 Tax=Listeria newyorkensis TaxID=1497681 RepID=A0ABX4XI62_9LIST|nr:MULTISPECIES: hypothetical protein [Listeria]KGL45005.1 hypothetical protein EP56_05445 [Listeriaceae bacterium FSL A5-0209]KGL40869.1 hypothetical protein EP58_11060 [Listeria newyorkensis]KMT62625.1 hypothetical protein X559_1022 [Listeria newyorkensis]PNP87090.1 hypothetical protein BMT55_16395 [Listeria newyorkensis]RQW68292.1 hypothetical protein DUK53_02670 [Listeria sp. SHR_NRA_18]